MNDCQVKFAWAGLHPYTAMVLAEHMFSDAAATPRKVAHRITHAPWHAFWYPRHSRRTSARSPG